MRKRKMVNGSQALPIFSWSGTTTNATRTQETNGKYTAEHIVLLSFID